MNTCVVVADGGKARFFLLERGRDPQQKNALVEQESLTVSASGEPAEPRRSNPDADPRHAYGARRGGHPLAHERRFAAEIVKRAVALAAGWNEGLLVLVAEPHLLGLLRGDLRASLARGIALKEIARDYSGFGTAELQRQLELSQVPGF